MNPDTSAHSIEFPESDDATALCEGGPYIPVLWVAIPGRDRVGDERLRVVDGVGHPGLLATGFFGGSPLMDRCPVSELNRAETDRTLTWDHGHIIPLAERRHRRWTHHHARRQSRQDQIPSLSEIKTSKAAMTRHDVAESDLPALKDLAHHLGELPLTRCVF